MILSPHFSWLEVERSATAAARGIDNRLPDDPTLLVNIGRTAQMLECVRALLDVPLQVTSWYRCPPLNAAVGSKASSMHPRALAVDFVPVGLELDVAGRRIAESWLPFDQLIIERARDGATWLHLGLSERAPRREVLLASGDRGAMTYTRMVAT